MIGQLQLWLAEKEDVFRIDPSGQGVIAAGSHVAGLMS